MPESSLLINLLFADQKLNNLIHRGYDSCGIGVDGPTNDGSDSKTVVVKRKGDNDVLTRGIQGAFESGELDPHRQIRRHVGLAHTRYRMNSRMEPIEE